MRDCHRGQADRRWSVPSAGIAHQITHRPSDAARSIAVPSKVKRYLGLDVDASWIVLDELNEFIWPGVDLRPVSRAKPGVWTFGVLPSEMFDEIRTKLRAVLQQRRTIRID